MARETKDIYELGEIPPEFHVPKLMHAWAIRRERHGDLKFRVIRTARPFESMCPAMVEDILALAM